MRQVYPNELYHYGVLGMKWGVRRYQNKDGSYTREGARHRKQNDSKGLSDKQKQRLKTGAAIAGGAAAGVAAGAAIYANRKNIAKTAKAIGKAYKTNKEINKANRDVVRERMGLKKRRRVMSDAEMKDLIERLKNEKQLNDLLKEDINAFGRNKVKHMMDAGLDKVLAAAIAGGVAYAGHYAVDNQIDKKQAANYLFPNPNAKKK